MTDQKISFGCKAIVRKLPSSCANTINSIKTLSDLKKVKNNMTDQNTNYIEYDNKYYFKPSDFGTGNNMQKKSAAYYANLKLDRIVKEFESEVIKLREENQRLRAELKQVLAIGVEMQREVNRKLSKENEKLKGELEEKDAVIKALQLENELHKELNRNLANRNDDLKQALDVALGLIEHRDHWCVGYQKDCPVCEKLQKINTLTGEG